MLVKPDWDVFKVNFSENPQINFEWMCYQLFCRKFGKDEGIFRFYNQPTLEAEPIEYNNELIGFQAKFYSDNLSDNKEKILNVIEELKQKYPKVSVLYFYSNKDWTFSTVSEDKKTEAQIKIEKKASEYGIRIEWKTKSFFESDFVTIQNSDITQYFFDIRTNDYYKKILSLPQKDVVLAGNEIFPTALYEKKFERPIVGVNTLSKFIINLFKTNDLPDFPDVFIRGIPGIGKSTEMKLTYNELIKYCSNKNCYKDFHFLPTPYFFELKNYQEGCFRLINNNETPVLFLDGLDEIHSDKIIVFIKELENLKASNPAFRFIISGRDASIESVLKNENRYSKCADLRLTFFVDNELQILINKFKGSVFEPFIGIPFYRTYLINNNLNNIKTYKEFIATLISSRLETDKIKFDRSKDKLPIFQKGIDLHAIQDKLSIISYKLFKSQKSSFSINELKVYFSPEEIFFISNSCLFDYKNEENVSFFSNIYYEYFIALFYHKKTFSSIKKELFIKTGKVDISYINIIAILLNLLSTKTSVFKKLSKKLEKDTKAYILLTDYVLLTNDQRVKWYYEIINEFNRKGLLLYYGRFYQSHNLLKNIDSLSDSMHNLLPEDFYDDALQMHCNDIKSFLENPLEANIIKFENAVILLGVHAKFWNEAQYKELKEISIPLIKFFRMNPLAERMKGLLSEDIILNWYEDYNWTKDWDEKEWNNFVQNIININNKDFYRFESEEDFCFKLKLFNHFNKNAYIQKLLSPIAQKILNNKTIESDSAVVVPRELDDNFETPIIHFDNDVSIFTYLIKQNGLLISDILEILNNCDCGYLHHTSVYQIEELYREIKNNFSNSLKMITNDEIAELYKLFVNYIKSESGLYLSDFNEFIKQLSDTHKELFFNLFIKDLEKNKDWQNLWMLDNSIVLLLNISDKKKASDLFAQIKKLGRTYPESVANIYISKWESHPLYETCFNEYPILFAKQVEKEEIRNQRLKKFEIETKEMFEKEIQIITNKELFIKEAENVINYIDTQKNTSKRDTDRGDLLDLQVEYIGNKIQYGDIDNYKAPPVFSLFTIKYLFNFTDDKQNLDRERAIKNIEEWFSDEKYFWRYFFRLYVCHYKKKDSEAFIERNPNLIDKIKKSMEMEVIDFLSNDTIYIYDGGQNRRWVVPFVYYLKKLFNNKLPSWVDKNKILNFIAYPAWQLSTGFGVHTNGEFKWENWNSVCEWIVEVSGITIETIIQKALEVLPLLKYDQSQTQIITIFVEKVKTETVYKQQMLNSILNKTIIEIQKDYTDHSNTSIMNGGALSSFWRETNENFVDDLYPYLNFSKYNPDDINYCRKMVFEYFCRMASEEQKNKTIALLREKINEENVKFYLAKLGYEEAIIKIIDEFIQGKSFETDYAFFTPLFGKAKESKILLEKYYELYEYSIAKNNDRRQYLTAYAKEGVFQTVEENNYKNIKRKLEKLINKRKKLGLYFEGIQDFLNEIEQRVYGKNKIGEK